MHDAMMRMLIACAKGNLTKDVLKVLGYEWARWMDYGCSFRTVFRNLHCFFRAD